MNTPKTRAEFERNFNIMNEMMINDKIRFASGLHRAVNSLMKVRVLPNGRIDFLSVDESARLQVNMMANMMTDDSKFLSPQLPAPAPTPKPEKRKQQHNRRKKKRR